MKLKLTITALLVAMAVTSAADNTFTNGVSTVYSDTKSVVDSVYHDGKGAIETLYSDAKAGASAIYPDVKEAVVSIGKAIGVAAEHVYTVLVKKYVVLGVKQLINFLLSLFLFIFGYVLYRKATPEGKPVTYRIILPLALMTTAVITAISVNYDEMLMGLINPEYGAINYILEYSKELVTK